MRGTGSGHTWHVDIDPPLGRVRTYYEETIETVEYVYANKTGKFQVLFSGGMDSQYVCEVLLKLGMEFDTIIIQLTSKSGEIYNSHDIRHANEFCQKKNITPTVIEVDFDKFVESGEILKIAESATCSTFAIPATMHVASQLDGFSLMGNDPPYLRLVGEIWMLEELEYIHSVLRYYDKFKLNGCPFLLSYSAEMMLSFLLDPSIKQLGTNQLVGKTGSNSTKAHVFNNGSGFSIEPYDFSKSSNYKSALSRIKFTGYEQIYHTASLMNHPNIQKFAEFRDKWAGIYFEPYVDVIQRLGVHQ